MAKTRRWLIASLGVSAAGVAAGRIEGSTAGSAPAAPEPWESDVPLGNMTLPPRKDRRSATFEKFRLGVAERSGKTVRVDQVVETLLRAAYKDVDWAAFDGNQATWCLLVVQAHILGQLAAYYYLLGSSSGGTLDAASVRKAWTYFKLAMSSATIGDYVDHPLASPHSKRAFKLPKMPPDPTDPTKPCWSDPKVFQVDQSCVLCP